MAYAAGDVIRMTMVQKYDEQQCLNVFYYKVGVLGGGGITPAVAGENFWEHVEDNWRIVTSDEVTFDRVLVENLDGDLSYGEYVIPDAERHGQVTTESMAAFVAVGIKLNRTSRLTRNGAKRIVGITESSVDQFGVLSAGAYTVFQELADVFADDLMAGAAVFAEPVIVGFPNDNRLARVEVSIDTATVATVITTQNSRKRGHGS